MKIGLNTILQIVALILVLAGFATAAGIAPLVIGVILLIGGLNVVGILKFGKSEEKGTRVMNGLVWGVTLLLVVNAMGWIGAGTGTKTLSTNTISEPSVQTASGDASAVLRLNVKNGIGSTYANTGTIYALKPGVVNTKEELMKLVQEGKTSALTPNSMTLASGVYSYSGYSGRVGDTVTFAGYNDATPAATENVSFVATATITGLTAGSTPEWMISAPQYVWYSYPTLLYYDSSDAAKVNATELEASAIEKTFTFYMFPTNNGEKWQDAALWLESPASNIAAVKRVVITCDGCTPSDNGMPYEIPSSENSFRAAPALVTSTDTMYFAGKFPTDAVRTSTSQKAKMSIAVTYDHPASGDVLLRFFVTQNTNALTSAGGHFDSPSTSFKLNLTDNTNYADGWNTVN